MRLTKELSKKLIQRELGISANGITKRVHSEGCSQFCLNIGKSKALVYKSINYPNRIALEILDMQGAGHIIKLFEDQSLQYDHQTTLKLRRANLEKAATKLPVNVLHELLAEAVLRKG